MSPSPSVLVLTPDLRLPGGVTHYYGTLRLDRHPGIEYFFVNTPEAQGPLRTALRLLRNYLRFVRHLAVRRPALVHVNPSLNARSFFRDGVFILLARLGRRPVLVFFRGWEEGFEARVRASAPLRMFFRLTYARVRHYIVLGERFEQRLRDMGVRPDARFWIETTVADVPASVSKPSKPHPGRMVVLFMSRVLASKGVFVAIDAVAEARRRLPGMRVELWVAGDGEDLEAAKRHAREKGLDDARFTGYVRGAEKQALLEEADVLLFPTWYGEGLPNVVLEAMAYGLVVVTRPVGAIPEVVEPGVNGFLEDAREPGPYARILADLAEDRGLRVRVAQANREAGRRFGRDAVEGRLLAIYDRVIQAAPAGAAG